MIQILRFEMNVPAEVALKDAGPGKPIEGRYGNRVMYTLADDRVMYVAPIVASRISDLGIQPGELFHVCKQVKRQGTQRLIEWQVERLPSEAETQLERDLRESIAAVQPTAPPTQPTETTTQTAASVAPPPLTRPGHFNRKQAVTVIKEATRDLSDCTRKGGVWGRGQAGVSFNNDGSVRMVLMSTPFLGPEGDCVRKHIKEAQIDPFVGIYGPVYVYFVIPY